MFLGVAFTARLTAYTNTVGFAVAVWIRRSSFERGGFAGYLVFSWRRCTKPILLEFTLCRPPLFTFSIDTPFDAVL